MQNSHQFLAPQFAKQQSVARFLELAANEAGLTKAVKSCGARDFSSVECHGIFRD